MIYVDSLGLKKKRQICFEELFHNTGSHATLLLFFIGLDLLRSVCWLCIYILRRQTADVNCRSPLKNGTGKAGQPASRNECTNGGLKGLYFRVWLISDDCCSFLHLQAPTFDVFNNGDSWNMAFRGTSGVKASAYDAYVNAQSGCADDKCLDVRYNAIQSINYLMFILWYWICRLSSFYLYFHVGVSLKSNVRSSPDHLRIQVVDHITQFNFKSNLVSLLLQLIQIKQNCCVLDIVSTMNVIWNFKYDFHLCLGVFTPLKWFFRFSSYLKHVTNITETTTS